MVDSLLHAGCVTLLQITPSRSLFFLPKMLMPSPTSTCYGGEVSDGGCVPRLQLVVCLLGSVAPIAACSSCVFSLINKQPHDAGLALCGEHILKEAERQTRSQMLTFRELAFQLRAHGSAWKRDGLTHWAPCKPAPGIDNWSFLPISSFVLSVL